MQSFVASITSITGYNRLNIKLTIKQTIVASKIRNSVIQILQFSKRNGL